MQKNNVNATKQALDVCKETSNKIAKIIINKLNHRAKSNADMQKNDFIDEIADLQKKMLFYSTLAFDMQYILRDELQGETEDENCIELEKSEPKKVVYKMRGAKDGAVESND